MTTEPFEPQPGTVFAGDTASIAPVTPEMLDHAAHAAADRAEALARDAANPVAASHHDDAGPAEEPAPPAVEPPPESPPAAIGTLQAADLAFNHGAGANGSRADGMSRAADNLGLFNAKLLEIAAGNVAAAGEFVTALFAAKSVPEAAAINADHLRRRLDALTTQGRELLVLAQRATFDALRPAGDGSRRP